MYTKHFNEIQIQNRITILQGGMFQTQFIQYFLGRLILLFVETDSSVPYVEGDSAAAALAQAVV